MPITFPMPSIQTAVLIALDEGMPSDEDFRMEVRRLIAKSSRELVITLSQNGNGNGNGNGQAHSEEPGVPEKDDAVSIPDLVTEFRRKGTRNKRGKPLTYQNIRDAAMRARVYLPGQSGVRINRKGHVMISRKGVMEALGVGN